MFITEVGQDFWANQKCNVKNFDEQVKTLVTNTPIQHRQYSAILYTYRLVCIYLFYSGLLPTAESTVLIFTIGKFIRNNWIWGIHRMSKIFCFGVIFEQWTRNFPYVYFQSWKNTQIYANITIFMKLLLINITVATEVQVATSVFRALSYDNHQRLAKPG